jgi:UDP-N-acetylglucosamine 3-dehydrogenase
MKTLLCGLGNMGSNHLRVLSELTNEYQVIGVVDISASHLQDAERRYGVKGFDKLGIALEQTKPEAVIVATPTSTHFEYCKEILTRAIPLFVEKPITKTAEEALELERLAEKNNVPFMVGHVERFNPAVVAMRELIKRGELGELVSISVKRVGGTPRDIKGAGDVLVDLAVHDIDLIYWLTDKEPELLECMGHKAAAVDSASMLFKCGSIAVDIQTNWVTPVKIRQIQVTGTKGFLEANLITQQVHWTKQNPALVDPSLEESGFFFDRYLLSFATPDRIELGISRREPLREELKSFHHAVQNKTEMPVNSRDARRALALAANARQRIQQRLESI